MTDVDAHGSGAPKTVLERHLAGLEPIKPTPLDAVAAARRAYHQGQRIDMGVLAAELGVSRVTLNRWVGTREDLLGEVTWDLMRRTLDRVDSESTATGSVAGGARVIAALRGLVESAAAHRGHQVFVEREGVLAMRINTSAQGRVEPRLVAYVRKLLTEEIDTGRMSLDADVDAVSYAVVQVSVAFIWRPFITGEPANPVGLESVLRLMLRDSSAA